MIRWEPWGLLWTPAIMHTTAPTGRYVVVVVVVVFVIVAVVVGGDGGVAYLFL
jgi:hypothetical protein